MTYREDESRVRDRTFAENLSWLRRMTLSLIKQHPSKQSNIMKRRMAGWSVDFLMQILTGKGTKNSSKNYFRDYGCALGLMV
jgi:hypothetical protein